ncbi:sodium/potassium-transporting ATPase subunit beta-2-like isoform X1 [Bacillus rossius redtenbacheri]|uniref:sodium/potassium-transporting ATPase subunit beta-2-like isoform X1 n=1 Tax=Bacillus rossius redtenbacheri TaxID=93214 RepID=UPI002FDE2EB4
MSEKKVEQYYTRPPTLGAWEGFRIFLWNSETHQFLGRTGSSWAKILFFYVLFYAGLSGYFAAMLAVFYQTLDMSSPKWQLDSSLIGSNPGLGFRPMPPEENVESTLIWYRASDKNYEHWTKELTNFLSGYKTKNLLESGGDNRVVCNYNMAPDPKSVCAVELEKFGACIEENNYGFPTSSPCIFLKLNKIFNWLPNYYNDTDSLPEIMPEDLKTHIRDRKDTPEMNTVWVSCEGENPADIENIGAIQYYPSRGFPGYYFPFRNTPGYLSPLVAVYFERPATGVLINIECKAWARNIHHDRAERRGSVHFELMVD